jgi:hypothetical protein
MSQRSALARTQAGTAAALLSTLNIAPAPGNTLPALNVAIAQVYATLALANATLSRFDNDMVP